MLVMDPPMEGMLWLSLMVGPFLIQFPGMQQQGKIGLCFQKDLE